MENDQGQHGEDKEQPVTSSQSPDSGTPKKSFFDKLKENAEKPGGLLDKFGLTEQKKQKLKFSFGGKEETDWKLKTKNKLKEYARVLKITKKPDQEEFKAIVKASGLGIIIIGIIGFAISMIAQLLIVR